MNKEEKQTYDKAYYEIHKEKYKAWREDRKGEKRAYDKVYNEVNKEKRRADHKIFHAANRGNQCARMAADYQAKKGEYFARASKRRALKIQAVLPTTDDELIKNLYELRKFMTEEYGEQHHVDHIIPLSIGGAHHQDNMRVITAKENLEKKDKYIPELGGAWADNDLAREYKKKHNIE
jgi:5-methylcytosine-specific restriction endonuclease McrA